VIETKQTEPPKEERVTTPVDRARVRPLILACLVSCLLIGLILVTVSAAPPPDPVVRLRLQAGSFDPRRAAPPLPGPLTIGSTSPYLIVQFAGPVRPEWRAALEAAGVEVLDYLPDYAYVVRLPVAVHRATLSRLPGVRWVGDLLPAYRLAPVLWEAEDPRTVTLQLFPGQDPAAVFEMPGVRVLEIAPTRWQTTLRIRCDGDQLPALAALPGVRWIEPFVPPELVNDVVAGLTGVLTAWTTLDLTGTGQLVAVADTGLDVGAAGTITDFAGRIVATQSFGRPATGAWDDPQGHGTHVAGSAVGGGVLSGGQFRGMAPGAGLVVQSLYTSTSPGGITVPSDLRDLLSPAYTVGARIHSNSWGVAHNRYDTWAQTADQFVWDHPDMLVVAAAGNGGIDRGADGLADPGSLYSPATAKNVLAVGAAESLRLGQGDTATYGQHGPEFPANPVRDDLISDEPEGLAAFSSRGPAADGRIRPDLVTPGTNLISARSHHPSAAYPFIYDDHYAFYSGSSQAAPIASGAAALARQWLARGGLDDPSAALVRALLIHGATDLAPGQYGEAVTGTVVISDHVEGSGVWTSATWIVTDTYGAHSPAWAWVAEGEIGFQRLDATVDLSSRISPTLFFWNRRAVAHSAARVKACGTEFVEYDANNGGNVGWALEAVRIPSCAGVVAAEVQFELQCLSSPACEADVWAVDDIVVADGARLAEVGPVPDPGQGWGRLDLAASLASEPGVGRWLVDEGIGLTTGQGVTYTLQVMDPSVPLQATLVWSDYPASPAAAVALVNDLDLELERPDGEIVYPNRLAEPDRANNVERIAVDGPVTGAYRLRVRGTNIPHAPQPFALLVTFGTHEHFLPLVVRGGLLRSGE
jgi:subtilisin family serine protease